MKTCDYTVVLFVYDGGDFEAFVSFVHDATSPATAAERGRKIAAKTSKGEYKPGDFEVAAVMVGIVATWLGSSQTDIPATKPSVEDILVSKTTRVRRPK